MRQRTGETSFGGGLNANHDTIQLQIQPPTSFARCLVLGRLRTFLLIMGGALVQLQAIKKTYLCCVYVQLFKVNWSESDFFILNWHKIQS